MSDLYIHLAAEDEARQLRIAKAMCVLKPGGLLVVCDGDYDTATCQNGDFDPFDQLVGAMIDQNVTKLWVMRQMAHMLTECGFELAKRRGHFYVAEGNVGSFSTEIDRGGGPLG